MLERAGFFSETSYGSNKGPSLRASVGKLPSCDVDQVVKYLWNAPTLAATGSLANDVLEPSRTGIAPLEVATDGEWAWPRDLAYYVREYNVDLPIDFLESILDRGGVPPALGHEALARAERDFFAPD